MKVSPLLFFVAFSPLAANAEPVSMGNRLELFADEFLIEEKSGVEFQVHRPEPGEVVLTAGEPWEGNTSGYFGVFQDGDIYRMVYRGWKHDSGDIKKVIHPEVTCMAVSKDGIYWEKPNLGVREFEGSKENNIIMTGMGCHNFTAFLDKNPDADPKAKYKAVGSDDWFAAAAKGEAKPKKKRGLYAFQSPDCIHWELATEKPVIFDGAFDSQNLAFWDEDRKEYRAYWRIFANKVRAIRTATSKDFIHWENQADLTYVEGTPVQHLYTNAIQKYIRAPHLFVGFPTRFLPDEGQRVEPIFMISRDGVEFTRYNEPVIPEDAPKDRKGNRSNYMTWGMLSLPEKPDEISVYATEAYYGSVPGRVRRFVYRVDGFVSLHAGEAGGEIVTKPVTFDGSTLTLNYAADPGGSVEVALLDESGKPVSGYSATLTGDSVAADVKWKGGSGLAELSGKPVKMRFRIENADLYSMRFH